MPTRLTTLISLILTLVLFAGPADAQAGPYVKTEGRQLMTDFDQDGNYEPFLVKGVGYNPTPVGRHPGDWGYYPPEDPRPDNIFDDPAILHRDFALLRDMNANAIRTWGGQDGTQSDGRFPNKLTNRTFSIAQEYGIKIIAGFYIGPLGTKTCVDNNPGYSTLIDITDLLVRNELLQKFTNYVLSFKDEPSLLFWAVGNENNISLNKKDPVQIRAWFSFVDEMAKIAHELEGANYHPVAVVNGDLADIGDPASAASDDQMPNLDIWGSNAYRGDSFGDLFSAYANKSQKPLWVAEFGTDAWHALDLNNPDNGYEDQQAQASWDGKLWDEIAANTDITIGGTLMAYSDQWWAPYEWLCGENSLACNNRQDHFGSGPVENSCPSDGEIDWYPSAPDQFFSEEWFGIMAISPDLNNPSGPDLLSPRPVYYVLREKFGNVGNSLYVSPSSVEPGGNIIVSFNAPAGSSWADWIGLFHAGAADYEPMTSVYTTGVLNGSVNFTAPAQSGTYEFRYFLNNGYQRTAVSNSFYVE